jgi:superfamily II DNA or RNA helicase
MIASGIVLRDYQRDAVAAVEHAFQSGQRRTLITLPTGSGKTIVFSHVVRTITATDEARALVLVHTEELIDQAERAFRAVLPKIEIGIVRAQQDEADAQVIIATVQPLRSRKRLQGVGQFDLIVIDEAHHAVAPTYRTILDDLGAFDAACCRPLVLGVTATADRGDGQGLGDMFESVAFTVGIDEMIQRGYLADIRAKRVHLDLDLDRVQRHGGDFLDGALGAAMVDAGAPTLIADAIRTYASDRKTVVFLPTVALAEETAAAIRAAGIRACAVSGQTPKKERKRIIEEVRAGRIQVVTNALVLTEGFDAPVLD